MHYTEVLTACACGCPSGRYRKWRNLAFDIARILPSNNQERLESAGLRLRLATRAISLRAFHLLIRRQRTLATAGIFEIDSGSSAPTCLRSATRIIRERGDALISSSLSMTFLSAAVSLIVVAMHCIAALCGLSPVHAHAANMRKG